MASPIVSDEERERRKAEARMHTITEGGTSAAIMAVVAATGHTLLQRYVPAYTSLNFRLKTFLWTASVIAVFSVRSEHAQRELIQHFSRMDAQRVAQEDEQLRRSRTAAAATTKLQ